METMHMTITDFVASARATVSDMPEEVGLEVVTKFPGHSAVSFGGPLTYAAYKDVPVTYILCEEDKIIDPSNQERMVKMMQDAGSDVNVVRLKCGHCPNVSQPEATLKAIRKAAGEHL
jgi:pimeloyl-ACP methyl ester carboxylesterase